jgi:hypothetical protein
MFQVRLRAKIKQVGATAMPEGVQAILLLCELYAGIRFTTEEKITEKTSVRAVEKCQLSTIQYVHMAKF